MTIKDYKIKTSSTNGFVVDNEQQELIRFSNEGLAYVKNGKIYKVIINKNLVKKFDNLIQNIYDN